MRKTVTINCGGDKTSHSVLSRGGYITEYEYVALPNYLVHLQNQNGIIVDIDVDEELNERVDGGDLDDDGDNVRKFDDTMSEVKWDSSHVF